MNTSVVAKMYVSATQASRDIGSEHTGVWAHLNAVYSPDKTTENYSFSQATPSATAKLFYREGDISGWDFKPGQFYRLYFQRLEDINSKSFSPNHLRCSVTPACNHGDSYNGVLLVTCNPEAGNPSVRVEITITNPAALGYFEPGGIYQISFEPTTKDGS